MARTAIDPTARNSDCQFCNVRDQKSALVTYSVQVSGSWSRPSRVSLKATRPAIDWASHDSRKIDAITSVSDQENTVVRRPPTAAQPGERSSAYFPTFWSLSDSRPAFFSSLDSGEPRWSSQIVAVMKRR